MEQNREQRLLANAVLPEDASEHLLKLRCRCYKEEEDGLEICYERLDYFYSAIPVKEIKPLVLTKVKKLTGKDANTVYELISDGFTITIRTSATGNTFAGVMACMDINKYARTVKDLNSEIENFNNTEKRFAKELVLKQKRDALFKF